MSRYKSREHIFKILFVSDFHPIEGMEEQIQLYFENQEAEANEIAAEKNITAAVLTDEEKTYIHDKVMNIVSLADEFDAQIDEVSKGWKTTRMSKVDLSILRLALYEMKKDDDVPLSVAINEAVSLAKKYSTEEAPAFINGILAKLAI